MRSVVSYSILVKRGKENESFFLLLLLYIGAPHLQTLLIQPITMAQAAPESDSEGYSSENENFKEIIWDQDDALGAFLDNFERFAHWDPNFANDLKDELLKFVHLCYRAMGWFDMGDSDWGPIIEEHCQIEWAAEDNDIHGPSYGAAAQQHTAIRDSLWFYENTYLNGIHQAASEEDPLPMHWASLMRIATLRFAWVHPSVSFSGS